jgi:ectoine hydroxylase-related dioxygenase (phytanoyl-CoA dioxygenase family)
MIIISYILRLVLITYNDKQYISRNTKTDIIKDGFIMFKNILNQDEIKTIKSLWDNKDYNAIKNIVHSNKNLLLSIKNKLGDDYILMDYIWFIENSVVHTCHRDNNSHIFEFNNYPRRSYTALLYIDEMDKCLDVIPGSNNNNLSMTLYDSTNTVLCKPGDFLLFDANLVHSGSLESNKNNRRIQLKITHKYDIEKIGYYNNVNRILNKYNTNSEISKVLQKSISCQFPIISDLTQDVNKESVNIEKEPSIMQKMYSVIFYSDENFYKLDKF